MKFQRVTKIRATAIRLTKGNFAEVVAFIRTSPTDADQPVFEHPDGLQLHNGLLVAWGDYLVHEQGRFVDVDAEVFAKSYAAGWDNNGEN